MSSQNTLLSNVMDKLDTMPIDFNITDTDIAPALNDTLRELGIKSVDDIVEGSQTELFVEIRTEYWMLHRFRNSQTLNFKYSTSIDGRSIDKTMIPTIIKETMDDLDVKFSTWKSSQYNKRSTGVWNRTQRTATRLT